MKDLQISLKIGLRWSLNLLDCSNPEELLSHFSMIGPWPRVQAHGLREVAKDEVGRGGPKLNASLLQEVLEQRLRLILKCLGEHAGENAAEMLDKMVR